MLAKIGVLAGNYWGSLGLGGIGGVRILAGSQQWIGWLELLIAVVLAIINALQKKK